LLLFRCTTFSVDHISVCHIACVSQCMFVILLCVTLQVLHIFFESHFLCVFFLCPTNRKMHPLEAKQLALSKEHLVHRNSSFSTLLYTGASKKRGILEFLTFCVVAVVNNIYKKISIVDFLSTKWCLRY
jgi:hypothetical protein